MTGSFTDLIDLASERMGGAVVVANDEFFAAKDRLVIGAAAVWREGEYTERGKWMDGWETRRRREPGNDWISVKLGAAGIVDRIEVDTAHYRGNYPDRCSISAAMVPSPSGTSVISEAMFWPELLGEQKLEADKIHAFDGNIIAKLGPVNHVRLNIFPDGGISRLRIFGTLA